jgi:NAD(P)H-nitrite reductase large subunit
MHHYIIIGSGVAGISAAETIRARDPKSDIKIIGDEKHGFYSRPGLAYFLTGEIPERSLFPLILDDFRAINTPLFCANVARIDLAAHKVMLGDGSALSYDRLLIATGASAVLPNVAGIDLEGVVKLDNLDDARQIYSLARKARAAVVVGGGITALELVEGLVARGVHTHYFLRGDRYWSNVLDETESHIVESHLVKDGVELHFKTELAEIVAEKGRVGGVRTRDGLLIPCQIVAVAIGIQPRKELAELSGIKTDRGILVNEFMQTSDPDVFAAGDVAQVFNPFTGRFSLDSLWGSARDQGRAAGLNMSGTSTPYHKNFSFNVTRLAGLTTTILGMVGSGRDADVIGIARGDSESWRQSSGETSVESQVEISHLRILLGKQTIVGAVLMGDQSLSETLQNLILNEVDISPVREKLLDPHAPLAEILTGLWDQAKAAHAAE